jgi:NTE family protein
MPKRAIVMSGGGSKGAFQVGAADYLIKDLKLTFDVVAGVSTGAVNAAALAQAKDHAELVQQVDLLKRVYDSIRSNRDVYSDRFLGLFGGTFGSVLNGLTRGHAYDPAPFRKLIRDHVDPQRIARSGRAWRVGAVDLESGQYKAFDEKSGRVHEATLASASMPVFFPPVRFDNGVWVDGGVRNVTPLKEAFEALKARSKGDAEEPEMWVLLASRLDVDSAAEEARREGRKVDWNSAPQVISRTLGILINELYREDLRYAIQINRSLRAYRALEQRLTAEQGRDRATQLLAAADFPFKPGEFVTVKLRVVLPLEDFGPPLEFKPDVLRRAYAQGRERARVPLGEDEVWRLLQGGQSPPVA